MGDRLRWFGAWEKREWVVGGKREAFAYGRGGRYQILRHAENCFVVLYRPPYDLSDVWGEIAVAATEQKAIARTQAHNDQAEDDVVRCPHCKQVLRTRWRAGLMAVERAKRLHERQLKHFAETQRRRGAAAV